MRKYPSPGWHVWQKEKAEAWKEQKEWRKRKQEEMTKIGDAEFRGMRKHGSEEERNASTFLGLNLPADCCRLHFPLPGRHGGELRHGCPWGGQGARQRESRETVHISTTLFKHTVQQDTKARQRGCMLAIDWPTSSIHTTHKKPSEADGTYWGSEKGKVSTSL